MPTLREILTKAYEAQEPLEGSPLQVEWASRISETQLDAMTKMLVVLGKQVAKGDMTKPEYLEAVRRAVIMIHERRASWWINHRDDPIDYLLCGSPLGFFRR